MSLFQDAYAMVRETGRQLTHADSWQEFPHAVHDIIVGSRVKPKEEGFMYADLHAHVDRRKPITPILYKAAEQVDILAFVRWPLVSDVYNLGIGGAIEKLEQEQIEHSRIGEHLVRVELDGKKLYLVGAVENYSRERQGVLTLGEEQQFGEYDLSLDYLVKRAQDIGTFWFLDHPMTIDVASAVSFRLPTPQELQIRRGWFEKYRPVIETGNHANTLHMYLSNVLARRVAGEMGLVGIANSDSHFNVKDIGRSHTAFPQYFLDDSSQEAFIESLKIAFSPSNRNRLIVESNYASVWSFGKHLLARIRND
ncbi:hypothetical protein HYV86_06535 [Candidatus Woesearchaeota archaeon]|nr:hypothetical protein [Candidatus Woesearchaeota archaeon]